VRGIIPDGVKVTLLGDGVFDGIDLQALVNGWDWRYVLRTGRNITLYWGEEKLSFDEIGDFSLPGEILSVPQAYFTEEQFGPLTAITWWGRGCKEPIFLITNMESAEDACALYKRRFVIETFFSDQKSRGS
jgi:hypothetical protein